MKNLKKEIKSLKISNVLKNKTLKIYDMLILLKNATNAIENNDFELADSLTTRYEFERKYDKILSNYILSYNELLELFYYFSSVEDNNKTKYLSWLLNTYYKNNIINDINNCIIKEDYENAAVLRDIQKIINMPNNKE